MSLTIRQVKHPILWSFVRILKKQIKTSKINQSRSLNQVPTKSPRVEIFMSKAALADNQNWHGHRQNKRERHLSKRKGTERHKNDGKMMLFREMLWRKQDCYRKMAIFWHLTGGLAVGLLVTEWHENSKSILTNIVSRVISMARVSSTVWGRSRGLPS